MANKKIIYFTVAAAPTVTEQGHIDSLAAYPGVDLVVRNQALVGALAPALSSPEPADYVLNAAGSGFVAPYDNNTDYPKITPTTPPLPTVLGTDKVIRSGVEFLAPATAGSRTDGWTPTIAANVVTALTGS